MKLRDIHKAFISGIYQLDTEFSPASFIKEGKVLNPEECLSVYRGSVFGNLSSALADIYPAFVHCVGEEFFQALALRYVKIHPSKSASLDNYGAEFSQFVSTFPPLEALPYAADLATLEWYWHLAFHAKDEQVLDPSDLSLVPEARYDQLVFVLPSSAHLMTSEFPLKAIWQKCLNEKQGSSDENEDDELELTLDRQYLMVWRAVNFELRVDALSDIEYALLSLVNKSKTLGTILTELQSKYSQEKINRTLARAVQQGWFTGFSLAG